MGLYGLCVGVIGLGKLELLCIIVLGMMVCNLFEVFNFFLVDFKGGVIFFDFVGVLYVVVVIINFVEEVLLVVWM